MIFTNRINILRLSSYKSVQWWTFLPNLEIRSIVDLFLKWYMFGDRDLGRLKLSWRDSSDSRTEEQFDGIRAYRYASQKFPPYVCIEILRNL